MQSGSTSQESQRENKGKGLSPVDKVEEKYVLSENDWKKKYLRGYRNHVRRIQRINAEITELRSMKLYPSMKQEDGMPHGGGGQSDLSDYAADLDEMIRDLIQERCERIRSYQRIIHRIKKLKSENERDVLFYRYIKGMDFWEIAEVMKYSERQIHRFHGKALAHFELPKDVIECHIDM